jgi:hypothetical protein
MARARKEGRIYWASVIYAPIPEYKEKLSVGPVDIPVVETPNPLLKTAAGWIRERMESSS